MTIQELRNLHRSGDLTKHNYIEQMFDQHRLLFDYPEFLVDTDIAKIEITDRGVVVTTRRDGIRLVCDADDHRLTPIEILNFGAYDRDELDITKKLLMDRFDGKFNMLDIGANVGWYSVNLGIKMPSAQIFSFEPIPKTFNYLTQNVAMNKLVNIETLNHGFSDKEGTAKFYYYREGSGNASLTNVSDHQAAECIDCQLKTVDGFARERDLHIDFIKCDVEGAELFVFQGARETLRRDRPIVFTEMLRKWSAKFDYHPNEIIALFEDLGYGCHRIHNLELVRLGQIDEKTVETNFFFVPND